MDLKIRSLLKNNLAFYALLYGGSAAILKITGFFILLFFARELSTSDYASFGLLYSLQTAISSFSIAGIIELIIPNLHKGNGNSSKNIILPIANSIFFVFTFIFSLFFLFLYIFNNGLTFSGFILILFVILNSVTVTYALYFSQLVRLMEDHKNSLMFSFLIPFLASIIGLIGYLKFKNITSFFATSFFVYLVLFFLFANFQNVNFDFDKIRVKRGILNCFPFIAMAFFNWISGYGNNQIIDLIFSSKAIASFTFLYSISGIMQLVATALNQVWSPKFYKITHLESIDEVERKNYKFYGVMSVLLGLVAGIVVTLLPILTKYIGGNAELYGQSKLNLFFLLSAYIILTPWWHCQNYFLAYNKGKDLFKITTYSTIIGMGISILLMLIYGEVGVYLGFFIVMFLRVLFIVKQSKLYWHLKLSWLGIFLGFIIFSVISFIVY
ncbi:MAG: hypothetical protein Q7U77_10985 [Sediminibacterium sp.]|uniref:lipopolysaccharide biosynthesis protein n=1 Tax=Sediminibacterium sp. TaxID=1917865 RepID=UPI0027164613|nr:hypothetical protein [Sediminibacterium sp.]MDO8997141.1 hypothetical protein [Sediminibacterium sp.]